MGDFNTRVGYGDDMDPSWLGVKGMFSVGHLNENGEHLLTFCTCVLNELCVMNIMFAKKRIYQYTWQHPRKKIWHCIDYVLMRHSQQHYCTDAKVFISQLNVGLIISWFVLLCGFFQFSENRPYVDKRDLTLALCIIQSLYGNL